VSAFHRPPLVNWYRVLQFDGVVLSRKTGAGAQKRPVLVALGIRLQDSVLGAEIVDDVLLLPVDQAGQDGQEEVPGL
jgi:hypothetical protein